MRVIGSKTLALSGKNGLFDHSVFQGLRSFSLASFQKRDREDLLCRADTILRIYRFHK